MKGVTASGKEYTVTHRMADGRILDDVTGMVIPVNQYTEIGYRILLNHAIERCAREAKEAKEKQPS